MESVRAEIAPTRVLRAGLNFSNFLLTGRDAATGNPKGIAVDLAREIGRRLQLPVEFVGYDSPGKLADAVKSGNWDIAFLGAEPARAGDIAFSAAYLEIEATYLVPPGSPLQRIADVDREGVRISVSGRSAYDLFLTRHIRKARLLRVAGIDESYQLFEKEKLEALSGLKPRLVADHARMPGSRLLEGEVSSVQQSVGTPRARGKAAGFLRAFVEDIKASVLVERTIRKHAIEGVRVAPPA